MSSHHFHYSTVKDFENPMSLMIGKSTSKNLVKKLEKEEKKI